MAEITKEAYEQRKVYADWLDFVTRDIDTVKEIFNSKSLSWRLIANNTEIVTLGRPMLIITKTGGYQFYIRLHGNPDKFYECDYLEGLSQELSDLLL